MSFSKLLIIFVVLLFGAIGIVGYIKKQNKDKASKTIQSSLVSDKKELNTKQKSDNTVSKKNLSSDSNFIATKEKDDKKNPKSLEIQAKVKEPEAVKNNVEELVSSYKIIPKKCLIESINRVNELFDVGPKKLASLVETITYKAKVSWLPSRAAWIADYASHYATSRHFIARSLNRNLDYMTQKVSEGDTFNVLRKDIDLSFYLVIDLSCCKMFFFANNFTANEKILLKVYDVGLGRLDDSKISGCLTPLGKYDLGSKVATYKVGSMGLFHGESVEMIKIFGTRWIPFDKEFEGCSERAKGFGIHGVPWIENKSNQLSENLDCICKYESDGCIRLSTADMEELFAIIITKPTTVEIVKTIKDSSFSSVIAK
jgi:hypothetical protein